MPRNTAILELWRRGGGEDLETFSWRSHELVRSQTLKDTAAGVPVLPSQQRCWLCPVRECKVLGTFVLAVT